jgi:hypothetical protein
MTKGLQQVGDIIVPKSANNCSYTIQKAVQMFKYSNVHYKNSP